MAGTIKFLQFSDGVSVTAPTEIDTIPFVDTDNTFAGVNTFDQSLNLKEVSTPSNPSSGYKKIYPKSDGKLYTLDSSGNEVQVGSGSGGGNVNLINDPNAESGVTEFTSSGTGITAEQDTTASNAPLNPYKETSIKLTNAGSGTGYTFINIVLPPGLRNLKDHVSWYQKGDGTYASGDYKIELHYYTDSGFTTYGGEITLDEDDSSGDYLISDATGKNIVHFLTSETYIQVRFVRVSGTGHLYLNELTVGTGQISTGPSIGPTTTVPMLQANRDDILANSSGLTIKEAYSKLVWQKQGDAVYIRFHIFVSGTGTDGGVFSIKKSWIEAQIGGTLDLGSGQGGSAVDYQFIPLALYRADGNSNTSGSWSLSNDTFYYDTNYIAGTLVGDVTGTDYKHFGAEVTVPVVEWKDSGTAYQINDSLVYANAKVKYSGLTTTAIGTGTQTIDFKTEEYSSGGFTNTSGAITIPSTGKYRINAKLALSAEVTTAIDFIININSATNKTIQNYSANRAVNLNVDGTIDLNAGDVIRVRKDSTGALTGVDQATRSYVEITRVAEYSAGQAASFATATSENAGLISKEVSEIVDLSADASYSTGSLTATRIGNTVTLTSAGATHSSATTVNSTSPILPEKFRPTTTTYFPYFVGGTGVWRIAIDSNGDIDFAYYTWAGAGSSQTVTQPFSVSYVIE